MKNHETLVQEFFDKCKEEDPERYDEVCRKYPVQTHARQAIINNREIPVGHLGLSASRVSMGIAAKFNVEAERADSSAQ
jgi:hypothetical protein